MRFFESFNYDVIIILILIANILVAIFNTLYRQGRRTLSLILPFGILYFLFENIFSFLNKISFINNFLNKITNNFPESKKIKVLIIYFACYLIFFFLISLLYNIIIRISVEKKILGKPSKLAKLISILLGVFCGYVMGMVLMFLLNPIIKINNNTPITKFYLKTANEFIPFSESYVLENVNVEKYFAYEESIGKLTGRTALKNYNEILETFAIFKDLENKIINEIYFSLSLESQSLLDLNSVLDSFKKNSKQILKNEKNIELKTKIRNINSLIEKNIIYLDAYLNLENYDYTTLTNYFIDNFALLISKTNSPLIIDEFTKRVQVFKEYQENKDLYLSLIPDYNSKGIIEADVIYYETFLKTNLDTLINNYENKVIEKDLGILSLFTKYINNKDKLNTFAFNLPLSVKLVMVESDCQLDARKLEKNYLVKAYIEDVVYNKNSIGYSLYSDYYKLQLKTN